MKNQVANSHKAPVLVILSSCFCILTFVVPVPGQAPTATAPASAPPSPIRVSSQLVVEDVSVTDQHGNPVHGLKAEQFTIFEDGKPQTIRHFDEHQTLSAEDAAKLPPTPKMDPGVFTNYTPVPEMGAVNVLLLDTLNTPLQAQPYLRQQLQQYLKTVKPGTRIAIFAMNRELHLLQGFTSNPETLKAAISGKRGMPQASNLSNLMNDAVGGDVGPDSSMSSAFADAVGNDPSFQAALAGIQQFEAQQQSFQLQMRAIYTLDALNQLARYLSGLPGKKNLIWFSGSFPIDILPDGDLADPFAAMGDSEDEFRETVSLMTRSHVAVYPVDARGLMVNPLMNAENSGHKYAADPTQVRKDTQMFFDQTASEHSTMLQMAEKTGGRAFLNTNGLKEAVEKAVDAGSNYYNLNYYPTNHKWDGRFHLISVKVADSKLKLTYRIGYYADDPDGASNKNTKPIISSTSSTSSLPASARVNGMRAAMQFGAPEPTQIVMKVRVSLIGDKAENQLAEGNIADPKIHGPYLRYGVDYAADARHVQFVSNPDGSFKAITEFAILVYDDQGQIANSISRTAIATVDTAKRENMIKTGMHFHQEISVPAKGHYWLRAGAHDRTGDRMGAVEINLDNVRKASSPTVPVTP